MPSLRSALAVSTTLLALLWWGPVQAADEPIRVGLLIVRSGALAAGGMQNGKLVNAIIKTYPAVSQFWTYNHKDFLANPVYSREYPPAINVEK
jgi:hypothetical protein